MRKVTKGLYTLLEVYVALAPDGDAPHSKLVDYHLHEARALGRADNSVLQAKLNLEPRIDKAQSNLDLCKNYAASKLPAPNPGWAEARSGVDFQGVVGWTGGPNSTLPVVAAVCNVQGTAAFTRWSYYEYATANAWTFLSTGELAVNHAYHILGGATSSPKQVACQRRSGSEWVHDLSRPRAPSGCVEKRRGDPATPPVRSGSARDPRNARSSTMDRSTQGMGSPPDARDRPPRTLGNENSALSAGFAAMRQARSHARQRCPGHQFTNPSSSARCPWSHFTCPRFSHARSSTESRSYPRHRVRVRATRDRTTYRPLRSVSRAGAAWRLGIASDELR